MDAYEMQFNRLIDELNQKRNTYEARFSRLREEIKSIVDELFEQVSKDMNMRLCRHDAAVDLIIQDFEELKRKKASLEAVREKLGPLLKAIVS